MTKHKILSQEEFSRFTPNPRSLHYIEKHRKVTELAKEDLKILDWGCGRGRLVLWLKENGYDAYGIDIDEEPITKGLDLFKEKGYGESALRLLSSEGELNFPKDYFHVIVSNQVFEHVKDIEKVATEMERITIKGGIGFHVFPAHKSIFERHLSMPFVHWLPKNRLRKYFISLCVLLRMEPKWDELAQSRFSNKVNTYYLYSIHKTFYRKPSKIRKIFRLKEFEVRFKTISNPKIAKRKTSYECYTNNMYLPC